VGVLQYLLSGRSLHKMAFRLQSFFVLLHREQPRYEIPRLLSVGGIRLFQLHSFVFSDYSYVRAHTVVFSDLFFFFFR